MLAVPELACNPEGMPRDCLAHLQLLRRLLEHLQLQKKVAKVKAVLQHETGLPPPAEQL